jgi:hypothetical protein
MAIRRSRLMHKRVFFPVIVLVGIAVLFSGCGRKNLSKDQAREFLAKGTGTVSRPLHKKLLIKIVEQGGEQLQNETEKQAVEKLRDAGYVSITEGLNRSGRREETYYQVTASPKLSPYVIREDPEAIMVRFGDVVIDEVTGVVQKGDQADVTYTTKVVPTTLGELVQIGDPSARNVNRATFRYQKGQWR